LQTSQTTDTLAVDEYLGHLANTGNRKIQLASVFFGFNIHLGVLQPLGLVDRHHLHQVAVRFQAQLSRVVAALVAALVPPAALKG
jgi:hypothetical protein